MIVDESRRVVSLGYNGFPIGVIDSPDRLANREEKYKMVVHAERNAILFAHRLLHKFTLYTWPFMPCAVCAAMVIQTGMSRVVAPQASPDINQRWNEDLGISCQMFAEAGVLLDIVDTLDT